MGFKFKESKLIKYTNENGDKSNARCRNHEVALEGVALFC